MEGGEEKGGISGRREGEGVKQFSTMKDSMVGGGNTEKETLIKLTAVT